MANPIPGQRWKHRKNGGVVQVAEVHPERNSITLLEPTARYTDRLSDFTRDFVLEAAPTMAELEAAGQQSIFGDES